MNIKNTIAALIVATLALPVLAQPAPSAAPPSKDPAATPNIDQRIANQQKRIDQGVKSGALTTQETARLEKREDKIKADTAAAKADGQVTQQERKRLQHELNQNSRAIHHGKHNRKQGSK